MGTRAWLTGFSAAGALWLCCAPAWAAPIQVNTQQDAVLTSDGKCSLREAISAANSDTKSGNAAGECAAGSGTDTISVPSGTYSLTKRGVREDLNATGDLDVFSSMTIQGAAGAASTFIDGTATDTTSPGSPDRVFDVYSASTVAINGVTIRNGRAPSQSDAAPDGGGILTSPDSTLSLDSDAITSNTAGAANSIGSGDGGGVADLGVLTVKNGSFTDNRAGRDGGGGAIAGFPHVTDTTFSGNKAGTPPDCGGACTGDVGGSGGAILGGSATVTRSTFVSNSAGDGGGGNMGGPGGSGGAIFNRGGTLEITDSTFSSNAAGEGGLGQGSIRELPGSGSAVMATSTASFEVTGSTFSSNMIPGPFQEGDTIRSSSGSVSITNSTLTSNTGGADVVRALSGTAILTNTTVASNAVPAVSGPATLSATLLASNTGGNCMGATITDGGNNLSYPASDTSCPAAFAHGDPKLASALADNGGPTQTLALGAGSAAMDGVPHAFCPPPAADQRGVARPQGGLCDIGAFEFATPEAIVTTPADGAHYAQGSSVAASYACTEAGTASLISTCSGTVANGAAIDTSAAGAHSFAVTATDKAGNHVTRTVGYTVDAASPGGGGGGGGVATVSGVHLSASTFRAAGSGPSAVAAKNVPTGAVVSFSLDRAATVKFTVERSAIGRRVNHRCVAPTKKNAKKPKCKRWVKVAGSFSRAGVIGINRFRFTGRLGGKRLRPGAYRLVITPQTGAQPGKPVRIGFHIVR